MGPFDLPRKLNCTCPIASPPLPLHFWWMAQEKPECYCESETNLLFNFIAWQGLLSSSLTLLYLYTYALTQTYG